MKDNDQKISAAEFVAVFQSANKPLVIDVRTAAEVSNEYLESAVNMPLHELSGKGVQNSIAGKADADEQTVYLLCGTGKRATLACEQVMNEISNPLVVIEGGIAALKQVGCPVNKGQGSVISLERQVRIAAGALVATGVLLGAFINPGFYALSAFVGVGLMFAGITDTCAMGMLLARMPWNNAAR